MLRQNFRRLKAFVRSVIKSFTVSRKYVRIGFIVAWRSARVVFSFNTRRKRTMMQKINRIRQIRGRLNLAKAIELARRNLFSRSRKNVPNVLLICTSGRSVGHIRSRSAATKRMGVTIITIGITPMVDQAALAPISSFPTGAYRILVIFKNLMNVLGPTVNKIILGMFRCIYLFLQMFGRM